MNNEPLVSVITPMYNAEKYILETIQSVIQQTYENWEMIIVDNKSTDNSISVVKSIKDKRIKVINLEYNSGGPARPRNIGLDNAKGDYVAFLDADDVWLSEKLKIQISEMIRNSFNFTSTNGILIDSNTEIIKSKYKLWHFFNKLNQKYTLCDLIKTNFISTSTVMIKKEIASSFDETEDFIAVEDFCLWMNLLNEENTKFGYISEKLMKYRILDTSISERGISNKQATKANLCILKFILDNQKFNLISCFYFRIIKIVFTNFVKRIVG